MTDNPALSPKRQAQETNAALRPKSRGEIVGQRAALGTLIERTYT
jgi:Holliday junction DNA helicase RuvB